MGAEKAGAVLPTTLLSEGATWQIADQLPGRPVTTEDGRVVGSVTKAWVDVGVVRYEIRLNGQLLEWPGSKKDLEKISFDA